MVDDDQLNEEYEFSDLDSLNPEYNQSNEAASGYKTEEVIKGANVGSDFWRNIIILIVVVVVGGVVYQYFAASKTTPTTAPVHPPVTANPVQMSATQTPVQPVSSEEANESSKLKALNEQINQLDNSQQNLSDQVSNLSNQFNSLNTNISQVGDEFTKINQVLSQISTQLSTQADEISAIKLRMQARPKVVRPMPAKPVRKPVIYYIQALIPGRAWLISSNGATLTISDGSDVPGYGKVKLIDPVDGVVVTSSGRYIRFSQVDS